MHDPEQVLWALLPSSALGGLVLLVGVGLGWRIAQNRGNALVRWTGLWLDHVVWPLLDRRSWAIRTAVIAANNSLVCFVVVLTGSLKHVGWLGVIGVGLGLGIALRLLTAQPRTLALQSKLHRWQRFAVCVGVVVNLLELPAILISVGLCLAQGAVTNTFDLSVALAMFGQFTLPLLLLAAAGEALWLTVCRMGSADRK